MEHVINEVTKRVLAKLPITEALGMGYGRPLPPPGYIPAPHGAGFVRDDNPPQPRGPDDPPDNFPYDFGSTDPIRGGRLT